jgi:E3 SUMO-protein ligase NSE2
LKTLDDNYLSKTAREKYDQAAEFLDFKRRVWDVNHTNVPPPRSWFEEAPEDDDIVVDQEIQSLKCPLTLQLLEEPVRNSTCPHVYSKAAILEVIRHGKGMVPCPVAGCSARVTEKQLREDKVMARKVREEKAKEDVSMEVEDVEDVTQGDIKVE